MTGVVLDAPTFPAASLDRRFYAFTLDRLLAWSVDVAIALAAYHLLIKDGATLAGVLLIVAAVLVVDLGLAVLQGLTGFTPGKLALGLRVVHLGTGTPIGVVPSMLRTLILGVAALPTFGLGLATLAWTAVMDRDRQRRGWHDHATESIVVDVRPVPVEEAAPAAGPRHIVNLTAMRLVPAPQPVPVSAPARRAPAGQPTPAPLPGEPRPANYSPPELPSTPAPAAPAAPAVAPSAARRPAPPQPTQPNPSRPPGSSTAERTIMREGGGAGIARWRVTFDTGESFLVEGLALVGRRPEPRQGEPVRHLVPLPSGDMSLSKTHAQFQVAPDGVLVVMDRGSTNGTALLRQGVTRELAAGKPTTLLSGDVVRFGDRQMTVVREG